MTWTEQSIASLRGMWREGVPCWKIGEKVGKTKDAVIGKANRLGLGFHPDCNKLRPGRPPEDRIPRPQRRGGPRGNYKPRVNKAGWRQPGTSKPPMEIRANIVDTEIPLDQRKTLLQLGENDCRFPVGDPTKGFWCNEEFFFCGGPTDGGPYCAGHAARVRYTRPANPPKHEQPIRQQQARPVQEPALSRLAG